MQVLGNWNLSGSGKFNQSWICCNNDNDFFCLVRRDAQSALDTVVDLCRRRLPERLGIPTDQIQLLSPTRRRGTGTKSLNQALQAALNP